MMRAREAIIEVYNPSSMDCLSFFLRMSLIAQSFQKDESVEKVPESTVY